MYIFLNSFLEAFFSSYLTGRKWLIREGEEKGKTLGLTLAWAPIISLRKIPSIFSIFFFFPEGNSKLGSISKISLVRVTLYHDFTEVCSNNWSTYLVSHEECHDDVDPNIKWYSILGHVHCVFLWLVNRTWCICEQLCIKGLLNNFQCEFI